MSRDENSIGKNIKRIREAAGMTQEKLGVILGSNQQLISAYENNRMNPSSKMLTKISTALNVTIDTLFENGTVKSDEYDRGYQAGYEAAKREILARMKHWVEGKEGEADGRDKDNKKTPRRISENDEKGHSSFRV